MGLNISFIGVRYRFQYRFQPGLNEKQIADIFFHLLLAGTLPWVHNSDLGGIEKNPFSAFNIVFIALTSRLKQKQSATKIANLADFRSFWLQQN